MRASRLWRWMAMTAGLVVILITAPMAAASYGGRAGRISLEYYQDNRGDDGTGPSHETFGVAFADQTGTGISRPRQLSCDAVDSTVNPHGRRTQVCPFSTFDPAFPGPGLGEAWAIDGGPSWSPDGRQLVFSGAEYAPGGRRSPNVRGCRACEAVFMAATDGVPRALPIPIDGAQQPSFLPGGRRLLFTGRSGPRARPQLYTVGLDGSGLTRLTTGGASEGAPCSDGSIVYAHAGGLYLRSPDGDTIRLTPRGTLPDCSPAATEITFVRGSSLYTVGRRGTGLRRLTHGVSVDGRAAFSPGGGRIAVAITTTSPDCGSRGAAMSSWLEIVDLRGQVLHRALIDRLGCGHEFPTVDPADVAWQPVTGP